MAKKATSKKTTAKKKTSAKKPRRAVTDTKPTSTAFETARVSEDRIRARAFEIYCSGVNPHNPDADWIQAEQELLSEVSR